MIQNRINKAKSHERNHLLSVKYKPVNNVIPYVSTHSPRNPEVFNMIINNLPILEEDPDMEKIFETSQIIKSKRQSPSLKCILTRASFSSKNQEPPIIKKMRQTQI